MHFGFYMDCLPVTSNLFRYRVLVRVSVASDGVNRPGYVGIPINFQGAAQA